MQTDKYKNNHLQHYKMSTNVSESLVLFDISLKQIVIRYFSIVCNKNQKPFFHSNGI